MRRAEAKVLNREALAAAVARRRAQGERVVFTNGCFDLLHVGHLRYLWAARRLGDCLIIAVNDDASVRRLKGPGRPVLSAGQRARVLAGLACVDYVTIFEEGTPHALLERLRPDVLVKGGNYPPEGVVGREIVEGYGGEIRTVRATRGLSTSELIRRVIRLQQREAAPAPERARSESARPAPKPSRA